MYELKFDDLEEDGDFIPFSREQITEMITEDIRLNKTEIDEEEFKNFSFLLKNIFHFNFHRKQEEVKSNYQRLNPNFSSQLYNPSD